MRREQIRRHRVGKIVAASPHEADAPLTIDPDAVLTRS
jgi:hypothetical protein